MNSYCRIWSDNKKDGSLWTPIIKGNSAIIELSVPHEQRQFVNLSLQQINQGYRSINKREGLKSGSCNNDVVCPEANDWRDEIRSVVHYSFTTSQGSFVCTGSLVNNTAGDFKPYVLTANHCVSLESVARTMVFYWNFETSVCDGTPDGSRSQNQSGATLRATWDPSDVTLVELDSAPSAAFNVHWAGWDSNAVAPNSAVAIHHPAGDEKRISFENDPLTITNYASNTVNNNGHYLRVGAWDDGTTEGGSSGSGIWNSDKRIVGTLTGGGASCDTPNEPDWYGRMSSHWDGGGTTASQLKAWLDPSNSGAMTLDGTDACTAPTASFTINPSSTEVGQSVTFTSSVSGGSSGTYSYQWDFNGDGVTDSTEASPSYTYQSIYVGNVNLTVTDNGCSANSSSAIVVTHAGGNTAPTAAVAQSSITVNAGANVQLDASSSNDPDNDTLSFSWQQVDGPTVSLSNANSSIANFTAPASNEVTYTFEVTVSDIFGASSKASVLVLANVNNPPPTSGGGSGGGGGAIHWLLLSLLGSMFIWRRKRQGD